MSDSKTTPEVLAERARCIAFVNEWLALFGDQIIKATPAREYATDAMKDLIEAIESGEPCPSQVKL